MTQVFFRLTKVSRLLLPSALRVPPEIFRFTTISLASVSVLLLLRKIVQVLFNVLKDKFNGPCAEALGKLAPYLPQEKLAELLQTLLNGLKDNGGVFIGIVLECDKVLINTPSASQVLLSISCPILQGNISTKYPSNSHSAPIFLTCWL